MLKLKFDLLQPRPVRYIVIDIVIDIFQIIVIVIENDIRQVDNDISKRNKNAKLWKRKNKEKRKRKKERK